MGLLKPRRVILINLPANEFYIYDGNMLVILEIACLWLFIIRLDVRLQPNIGFTIRRVLAVFTRSAMTPPKVNRFGWNLEHSENTVGAGSGRFWAQ